MEELVRLARAEREARDVLDKAERAVAAANCHRDMCFTAFRNASNAYAEAHNAWRAGL